jgi:adenosylcobinamide-phosphate synthase
MSVPLAFLSLLMELAFGYPDRLVRAIGHPVIWIGNLISLLDRRMNRPTATDKARRISGVAALIILLLVTAGPIFVLERLLGSHPVTLVLLAVLGSSLLAQRSLASHVKAVADALDREGVAGGRKAVSMIVGRDPEHLDEAAVCRAAIESLAENFSDGIVAPALWMGVGGLTGGVAYKAVNTADSMIGHRTPKHEAFGWASARADDLINLPASRLTAALIMLAAFVVPGADAVGAWRALWRDASRHRSPNAGWPEAAMAGALAVELAGPRSYGGVMTSDGFMGEGGRREADAEDIRRALTLYWTADLILVGLFGVVAASVIL